MAEYIDKKALLDEICRDNCERPYDGTCHNCRMTETIADFPAADVAPVVRCKNCTWHESAHGVCSLTSNESIKNFVHENDFCSYGERKEPGNEHQNPPGH